MNYLPLCLAWGCVCPGEGRGGLGAPALGLKVLEEEVSDARRCLIEGEMK